MCRTSRTHKLSGATNCVSTTCGTRALRQKCPDPDIFDEVHAFHMSCSHNLSHLRVCAFCSYGTFGLEILANSSAGKIPFNVLDHRPIAYAYVSVQTRAAYHFFPHLHRFMEVHERTGDRQQDATSAAARASPGHRVNKCCACTRCYKHTDSMMWLTPAYPNLQYAQDHTIIIVGFLNMWPRFKMAWGKFIKSIQYCK